LSEIKHTPYNIMKSAVDMRITPSIEEIKKINSFFLVRYISNDPASIYIANAINCHPNIPIEAQYKLIQNSTLDKVAFINYPKKEKKLIDSEMKIIMHHFSINKTIAKEYIEILGIEKCKEIIDKYPEKMIKKL